MNGVPVPPITSSKSEEDENNEEEIELLGEEESSEEEGSSEEESSSEEEVSEEEMSKEHSEEEKKVDEEETPAPTQSPSTSSRRGPSPPPSPSKAPPPPPLRKASSPRGSATNNNPPPPAATTTSPRSGATNTPSPSQTQSRGAAVSVRQPTAKHRNEIRNSQYTCLLILAIFIVAGGVAVIITLFVTGPFKSDEEPKVEEPTIMTTVAPSLVPTAAPVEGGAPFAPGDTLPPVALPPGLQQPLSDQDQVDLLALFATIVGDDVYLDGTSEALAANWIFFEDPRRDGDMPPPTEGSTLEAEDYEVLLQRYLLVFFYYSTTLNKSSSWLSCGEPSADESSFCMYLKLITPPYDDINPDIVNLEYTEIPWIRWLTAADECDWAGITCVLFEETNNDIRRVTDIDLSGQGLKGSLVSELVLGLPELESLIFNVNQFTGTLVEEYGQLETLEVAYNELTGIMPTGMFKPTFTVLQNLNIGNNMLFGSVPDEISFATNLRNLLIFDNQFTDEIPQVLGNLALERFQAQGNQFVGSLPLDNNNLFWTNTLEQFWVQNNLLSGEIPSAIHNFQRLEELRISFNDIRGTIPELLYDVTSLIQLSLDNNALSGTISPLITRLSSLEILDLSSNNFSGNMVDLSSILNLEVVKIQFNQLEGEVPRPICSLYIQGTTFQGKLTSLEADCLPATDPPISCICCTLCCNQITRTCSDGGFDPPASGGDGNTGGPDPDDPELTEIREYIRDRFGNDADLTTASAHAIAIFWIAFEDPRQLTITDSTFEQRYILALFYILTASWRSCNPVPNDLSQTSCVYEKFVRNDEDGTISYESVPGIRWLSGADECDWVGVQCDPSGNVVGIIDLFGQGLQNSIPTDLLLLPGFSDLQIAYNELTGTIPEGYGSLPSLNTFMVHGNLLEGSIPATFFESNNQLSSFIVGDNILTSTIPTQIGLKQSLQAFHVFSNQLQGDIPFEFYSLENLQFARLNDNRFTSSIPTDIANLRLLQEFWLQGNSMTGPILPAGVNFPSLQFLGNSLRDLRLSDNEFSSTIPTTIGALTALVRLELSSNNIIGSIPTEMGLLTNLIELRIDDNGLASTIPAEFSNLSNLEVFWLQENNMGGVVPTAVCSIPGLQIGADCLEVVCACCTFCCADFDECALSLP